MTNSWSKYYNFIKNLLTNPVTRRNVLLATICNG